MIITLFFFSLMLLNSQRLKKGNCEKININYLKIILKCINWEIL